MSKLRIFVSATIVLFYGFSYNLEASPSKEVSDETPYQAPQIPMPIDDSLAISRPTQPSSKSKSSLDPDYYPFKQQFTLRIGRAAEISNLGFDDMVLGFQYLFPKFLSPKIEAGADLREQGRGHLHLGLRTIFNERSYFRPSFKLGLDHQVKASDGLGSLTHYENYFVRLSGTLEYVAFNPYSLRLEAESLAGFKKTTLMLSLGLSRGW